MVQKSFEILIVEDEAIVAMSLKETIEKYGYNVSGTAYDSSEALKIAKEKSPDLVLMDVRINGSLDGIETACEIKKICNASVIFITAYNSPALAERFAKVNPSGYLVKPFREPELIGAINRALNQE